MNKDKPAQKGNYGNETTYTFGGITTPPDQEDMAATDPISEAVAAVMDNLTPGEDEEQ